MNSWSEEIGWTEWESGWKDWEELIKLENCIEMGMTYLTDSTNTQGEYYNWCSETVRLQKMTKTSMFW